MEYSPARDQWAAVVAMALGDGATFPQCFCFAAKY
jgi:hypothetical protein